MEVGYHDTIALMKRRARHQFLENEDAIPAEAIRA
jgi:hypothetical protein